MSVIQASEFFVATILFMFGAVVLVSGIIVINNLFHRFWKPVKFGFLETKEPMVRFATDEEIAASSKDK